MLVFFCLPSVQFQAVLTAVRLFNWTCVAAVHQTEGIGRRALEVLYAVFDTDDSVCLRSVHSINRSLTEAQVGAWYVGALHYVFLCMC